MKVLPNCHGREFRNDKNGRQSSIGLVTMTKFSKKQGSPQKLYSTMWVGREEWKRERQTKKGEERERRSRQTWREGRGRERGRKANMRDKLTSNLLRSRIGDFSSLHLLIFFLISWIQPHKQPSTQHCMCLACSCVYCTIIHYRIKDRMYTHIHCTMTSTPIEQHTTPPHRHSHTNTHPWQCYHVDRQWAGSC